jgi:hypothetical protein
MPEKPIRRLVEIGLGSERPQYSFKLRRAADSQGRIWRAAAKS